MQPPPPPAARFILICFFSLPLCPALFRRVITFENLFSADPSRRNVKTPSHLHTVNNWISFVKPRLMMVGVRARSILTFYHNFDVSLLLLLCWLIVFSQQAAWEWENYSRSARFVDVFQLTVTRVETIIFILSGTYICKQISHLCGAADVICCHSNWFN